MERPDDNIAEIAECNSNCACDRTLCRNRLVQHSSSNLGLRFQVFLTDDMGWGVRTMQPITAGTYICEYIGEIIGEDEAQRRARRYRSEGKNNYLWTQGGKLIHRTQSNVNFRTITDDRRDENGKYITLYQSLVWSEPDSILSTSRWTRLSLVSNRFLLAYIHRRRQRANDRLQLRVFG